MIERPGRLGNIPFKSNTNLIKPLSQHQVMLCEVSHNIEM